MSLSIHHKELFKSSKEWINLRDHFHEMKFKRTMQRELNSLQRKDTFKQMNKFIKMKVTTLSLLWVFMYKFNNNEYLMKHKTCLCVQENYKLQNFYDNCAVILAIKLFQFLMMLIAAFDLKTKSLNVINVFINNKLDENIYCRTTEKFRELKIHSSFILLLQTFYRLHHSLLLWLWEFTLKLKKKEFELLLEHFCFFINNRVIIFFYVNDIILLFKKKNRKKLNKIIVRLMRCYKIKNQSELHWFLNIQIIRNHSKKKLWLCQNLYINKIVNFFNLQHMFKTHTFLFLKKLKLWTDE